MKETYNPGRRNFIFKSALTTLSVYLGFSGLNSASAKSFNPHLAFDHPFDTGFSQDPLPYGYDALEDVIDAKTMEIHYTKHAAGYSKNLKEAVAAEGVQTESVEKILKNVSKYSSKMRNNAGGHYNHELFWKTMRPKTADNKPTGKLEKAIEKSFGSVDAFKTGFADAAAKRFGSGWAWLYIDADKELKIASTANQDNPLMDLSKVKGMPILGLDVWEHAYYLKYQNRRADYINNWWQLVNWDFVEKRYEKLV